MKDIISQIESGKGPKNSGDFITMLSSRLFERMEPTLSSLDERTDVVEERVMDIPDGKDRQEIISIRKQAIVLRRYIAPQKDVMAHLKNTDQKWLDHYHKR